MNDFTWLKPKEASMQTKFYSEASFIDRPWLRTCVLQDRKIFIYFGAGYSGTREICRDYLLCPHVSTCVEIVSLSEFIKPRYMSFLKEEEL